MIILNQLGAFMTVHNKIYTLKQTAEILKVTPGTLKNWRSQGKGPRGFELHRTAVMFEEAEINKFINERIELSKKY